MEQLDMPLDITTLGGNAIWDLIGEMNYEKELCDLGKDDHLYPDKFSVEKFKFWQIPMENFLDSKHSIGGTPLLYVIHDEGLDPAYAADEHERAIGSASLVGLTFDEDNLTVYCYYKNRVIDTQAWTWFSNADTGDGCAVAFAIKEHYAGPAAVNWLACCRNGSETGLLDLVK
jgi:hypothetical protein